MYREVIDQVAYFHTILFKLTIGMTATACCTSSPIIYQIQLVSAKSQFTPILPRTAVSASSPIISITEIPRPIKVRKATESDVKDNNNGEICQKNVQENFDIPNDDETVDAIIEERFLILVGLRRKTKKPSGSISTLRPLAKRLATPICLLPLPKHAERVRQALYVLLPFLKFLSITHDVELFCSMNDQTKDKYPLPRSATQMRTTKKTTNKASKRKVSKSGNVTIEEWYHSDTIDDVADYRRKLPSDCIRTKAYAFYNISQKLDFNMISKI